MKEIDFKTVFTGKANKDKYEIFKWIVTINGESFDYSTGSAHFTPYYQTRNIGSFNRRNKKPDNGLANSDLGGWLHAPTVKDVLYSVLSDASFGDISFNDFCNEIGYSDDPFKAFDIYQACCNNGEKLRKALTSEQIEQFEIELEDY